MAMAQGLFVWDIPLYYYLLLIMSRRLGISWLFSLQEVTTDPLVQYCEETPEADECRVYED